MGLERHRTRSRRSSRTRTAWGRDVIPKRKERTELQFQKAAIWILEPYCPGRAAWDCNRIKSPNQRGGGGVIESFVDELDTLVPL